MTTSPTIVGDSAPTPPYALITSAQRKYGTIIPDITFEETANDSAVITKHPVQFGCPISDHAYKLPPTIQAKIAFSDVTKGQPGYAIGQYNALLSLQSDFMPFDVFTGKRAYQNMLIAGILQITDPRSENIVQLVIIFEFVRITNAQVIRVGGATGVNSTIPQATAPPVEAGNQQGLADGAPVPIFAQPLPVPIGLQ